MADEILQKSQELLKDNAGIVYGENHLTPVAPDWIRQNLSSMKESGVTTVFMEIKDRQQPLIDEFIRNGDEVKLREGLSFGGASQENETSIENLIIESRNQGLRVVAMDLEDPTKMWYDDSEGAWVKDKYDDDRLEYSNPAWAERVKETMSEQPKGAKYVMLAGEAHTNKTDDPRYRGIDSILGVPSIDIKDTEGAERHNSLADALDKIEIPKDIIASLKIELIDGITRTKGREGKESDYVGILPKGLVAGHELSDGANVQPPPTSIGGQSERIIE